MNSGYSSRLPYDTSAYNDKLSESVAPGNYRLNTNYARNDTGCLQTLGPRGSHGVSTIYEDSIAPSQQLVGIESILTNRNMRRSKSKRGSLNPINVTEMPLKHNRVCNSNLNSQHTRFTYPAVSYRGAPINRFINLLNDPQENIFYNFEVNTTLEAKDNWIPDVPSVAQRDQFPASGSGSQTSHTSYCPAGRTCNANFTGSR